MHSSNAAAAYSQTNRSVGTPRSIEYQAFSRVTAMLQNAMAPNAPLSALAEAVHLNTKLWVTLAADLISEQNQLPEALRAQLFNLAEFSRRHGLQVLQHGADPRELVDINSTIMRGLRSIALTEQEAHHAAAETPTPTGAAAAAAHVSIGA